jgi:DNA-directed RNA polymerase specialized sigma24 family protein
MYALIGDLVGSRRLADRAAVHVRLRGVLAEVAALEPGLQELEATVGDEFQGAYQDPRQAARVALLVRLAMLPAVDVRCGIGEGEAETFDADRHPRLQDGPAWWAAREALERMAAPRRSSRRTWLVGGGSDDLNARLMCRDALVDRLNDRGRRMLALALRGHSQQEIAAIEGVSKSAVSQAFARGITAVRDAENLVRGGSEQ